MLVLRLCCQIVQVYRLATGCLQEYNRKKNSKKNVADTYHEKDHTWTGS